MLAEVRGVRQIEKEGFRRWFGDSFFDLIVWFEEGDSISGFQLCYDKSKKERALTWRRQGGYIHEKIDDGEIPGRMKMTPILVPDGAFAKDTIAERFRREAENIDAEIRDLVYQKLLAFDE